MSGGDRLLQLVGLSGVAMWAAAVACAQGEEPGPSVAPPPRNWAIIVDTSGSMRGNPDAKQFVAGRLAPTLIGDGDCVVMFNFDAEAYATGPDSPNLIFIESGGAKEVADAARGAPWPISTAQGTARKWAVAQAMTSLDRVRGLDSAYAARQNVIVAVTDTDVDAVTAGVQLANYDRALSDGTLVFLGEARDMRPKSRLRLILWAYMPSGAAPVGKADGEALLSRARESFPPPGPSGAAPEEDLIRGELVGPSDLKWRPGGRYSLKFEITSEYDSAFFAGSIKARVEDVTWDGGSSADPGSASVSELRFEGGSIGGEIELEPTHTGDAGELRRDTVQASADVRVTARPAWWDPRQHTLSVEITLEPDGAHLFAAPVAGPNRVEKARLFGIQARPYTAAILRDRAHIVYPFNPRPLAYFGVPLIVVVVLGGVAAKARRRRPVAIYFHVAGSEESWAQRNVLPKTPVRIGSQFATPGKDVAEVTQAKEGLVARPVGDAVLLDASGADCGGALALGKAGSFQVQTTILDAQQQEKRVTIAFEYSSEPVFGGPEAEFTETFEDVGTGETFEF